MKTPMRIEKIDAMGLFSEKLDWKPSAAALAVRLLTFAVTA